MPPIVPRQVIDAASAKAVELTKSHLGVTELSQEIHNAIRDKTEEVAASRLSRDLDAIAGNAVAGATAHDVNIRIKDSLATGVSRINAIVADSKYAELVEQSARMLFRKYQALKNAGFTDEQSFELVKAETLARGGRGTAQ